ncbi:hypothetical protein [Anaerosolibacter sp.]|uniref:hypothetical protein n=1 Tax=Anaerosolibacter sp. TaxID=1872527 RepID=UPI0039F0DAE9
MKKAHQSWITLVLAFMIVGGGVTNAFTPTETKELVYDYEPISQDEGSLHSRQC